MSQRFDLSSMAVAGLLMLGLSCVKGTEIVDGQVVIIDPDSPDASADPADAARAGLGPAASTPPSDSVAPRPPPAAPPASRTSDAPGGNAATPSVTPAPGANAASNGTTQPDAGVASPLPAPVVPPAVVDAGVSDAASPS